MTYDQSQTVISRRSLPTEVVKIRRWGRRLGAVCAIVILAAIIAVFATSKNVDWPYIAVHLLNFDILSGLIVTIELTALAMLLGVILGTVLAIMRLSENPVLRIVAGGYVWFVRSIPQLVQLLFWYNVALFVPRLGVGGWAVETNAVVTTMVAAVLGLALNEAAYMSEIVRAGIMAVDPGQRDAAKAAGYHPGQILVHVVLPQAMRLIIPPTSNELIGMLKATSLVSVIGASDLLTRAQSISSSSFKIIEMLFVASFWYIVATTLASFAQHYLEQRYLWRSRQSRSAMLSSGGEGK